MDEDMYRQYILDVFKQMSHKHALDNADAVKDGVNSSCGDSMKIYLKMDDKKIINAAFTGNGCLLSQVSAELLIAHIEGKDREEIRKLVIDDLEEIVGIHPTPSRLKCMELSLKTVQEII